MKSHWFLFSQIRCLLERAIGVATVSVHNEKLLGSLRHGDALHGLVRGHLAALNVPTRLDLIHYLLPLQLLLAGAVHVLVAAEHALAHAVLSFNLGRTLLDVEEFRSATSLKKVCSRR